MSSRLSLPAAVVALTAIAAGCFYLSRALFLTLFLGCLYGTALVTIAFLPVAIPRFRRIKNRAESKQTRWAFQLHTIRSILVALAPMALILMMLVSFEGLFIFLFVAAVPYAFFGVPAVGALIANLLKGQPDAELFYKDRWVWVSRLLTSLSWVISAVVIALAVAVFQPWPISLREGPDTEWSGRASRPRSASQQEKASLSFIAGSLSSGSHKRSTSNFDSEIPPWWMRS